MNELVSMQKVDAVDVFVNGNLYELLNSIKNHAMSEARKIGTDVSTKSNREAIASLAWETTRSKTALFDMAFALTEDWRKKTKSVNNNRKVAVDFMEVIISDIRLPLTQFENKEKARVEDHEAALSAIEQTAIFVQEPGLEEIREREKHLNTAMERDWEEFQDRAKTIRAQAFNALSFKMVAVKKRIEQEEEATRLRKENEALLEEKRINDLRVAAEEKARNEAAEQVRLANSRADQAAKDANLAAENERNKIAAENAKAAKETADRESSQEHRHKINNEALEAIAAVHSQFYGEPNEEFCKAVVEAIAKGQIPNVKINY